MKIPHKICTGQAMAPHCNTMCFIRLLRPYILSFLLVLFFFYLPLNVPTSYLIYTSIHNTTQLDIYSFKHNTCWWGFCCYFTLSEKNMHYLQLWFLQWKQGNVHCYCYILFWMDMFSQKSNTGEVYLSSELGATLPDMRRVAVDCLCGVGEIVKLPRFHTKEC